MAIFVGYFVAKIVILSSIDFYFGFPINLDVNNRQNKYEVEIFKNMAKIANFRLKIGQLPLSHATF